MDLVPILIIRKLCSSSLEDRVNERIVNPAVRRSLTRYNLMTCLDRYYKILS